MKQFSLLIAPLWPWAVWICSTSCINIFFDSYVWRPSFSVSPHLSDNTSIVSVRSPGLYLRYWTTRRIFRIKSTGMSPPISVAHSSSPSSFPMTSGGHCGSNVHSTESSAPKYEHTSNVGSYNLQHREGFKWDLGLDKWHLFPQSKTYVLKSPALILGLQSLESNIEPPNISSYSASVALGRVL